MASESPSSPSPDTAAPLSEVPLFLFVRGLLLLTVMLSLMVVLHRYIGLRLIRDAALAEPFAGLAWGALWAAFGSIFVGFIGGRTL
ncbi:MAG: hypothetical protein JNG84_06810, partial [Archangium sp.]|nr:hypothetical protein [Archangium sp.]